MGDSGGMRMETDATTQVMAALAKAGTAILKGWTQSRQTIAGMEGRLGQGPMGQAFMAAYKPAANGLDPQVQSCAAAPLALADAGHRSAADYELADEIARDSFPAGHGN